MNTQLSLFGPCRHTSMSADEAPSILYLCTIWRRLVNFTGWPLLCQGKNPQFSLLGSAPEPFWAFLSI